MSIDVTPPDELVPGWLVVLAALAWRVIAIVALALVVAWLAIYLSTVTAAILVAVMIAATVAPLVQDLRDRGWSRATAAAGASLLALAVLLVLLGLVAVAFVPYVVDLVRVGSDGVAAIDAWLSSTGAPAFVVDAVAGVARGLRGDLVALTAQLIGPITGVATVLLLGAFVTFYMLEDGDRAWATAIGELEPWRVRLLSDRAVLTLQRLGGYLRGTVLLAMANALWAGAVLLLTGVPFAGPLATISLFARFVPYYGAIFADAVILVVTFALRGSGVAGLVLVLLLAGDILLSRTLRSRAYGPAAAGVNPALVLIAVPFGGAVAGVLGMFAATPVVGVASALGPALRQALDTGPDSTADRALVPHWLDRLAQWSWRVLAVVAAGTLGIAAITVTSGVAVVIVIALILAIVFEPIVLWLGRKGIGRGLAALLTVGGGALALVALLTLTVSQLVVPLPAVFGAAAGGAAGLGLGTGPVELVDALRRGLAGNVAGALGTLAGLLGGLAAIAIGAALMAVLAFYLLRDGARWWAVFLDLVPADRRDRTDRAGRQAGGVLGRYMVGTTIISAFGGVCQWLVMAVLGLPFALALGILTFLGGYIPFVGTLITTILGFLVAVAVGDGRTIILMLIFTVALNILQTNIVAPLIYRRTVSIHPAVVILAIPAGAQIAGIMGMFLVVPFLAIVASTGRSLLRLFDTASQRIEEAAGIPVGAGEPVTAGEPVAAREAVAATGLATELAAGEPGLSPTDGPRSGTRGGW